MRQEPHGSAAGRSAGTNAAIPRLEAVRAVLRRRLRAPVALDELTMRHVNLSGSGAPRVLYEAPGPDGDVVRITGRRVGAHLARQLEARFPGSIHAPELGVLFTVFPADEHLPGLPVAADGRAMAPVLEVALARRRESARLRDVDVRPLRYKPTRKCLLRYELTWTGADGGRRPRVVYGRVARGEDFDAGERILPQLHDAAREATFALPAPLGIVPPLGLQLFSSVPGEPLFHLVGHPRFAVLCARTGAALHEFQALPVVLGRTADLIALAARLAVSAGAFAELAPDDERRIRTLARQLIQRIDALPPARPRLIHGDFHGDNVLVDGDALALIDLEDCVMGEPAEDAGLCWAQLNWHAVKRGDSGAAAGRDAFLEAYAELADAATVARVPVHAAAQSFLGAYQCLRRPHEPERHQDAEILLAACEDVLACGF